MKVILDLKELRVTSMDNAMINIGKNWIVMKKKERGEKKGQEEKKKSGEKHEHGDKDQLRADNGWAFPWESTATEMKK